MFGYVHCTKYKSYKLSTEKNPITPPSNNTKRAKAKLGGDGRSFICGGGRGSFGGDSGGGFIGSGRGRPPGHSIFIVGRTSGDTGGGKWPVSCYSRVFFQLRCRHKQKQKIIRTIQTPYVSRERYDLLPLGGLLWGLFTFLKAKS